MAEGTDHNLSRRDTLKLAGVAGGAVLLQNLIHRGAEALVHNAEIGAGEEALRSIARDNLVIPEDWPGEKRRLLSNPDYRSPVDIFDEAIEKVKKAGVTPVFKEPKDSTSLAKEGSTLLSINNKVIDILISNVNKKDPKFNITDYASTLMSTGEDEFREIFSRSVIDDIFWLSSIDGLDTFNLPGIIAYSGISQRAFKSIGIMESDPHSLNEIDYSKLGEAILTDFEDFFNSLYKQRVKNDKPLSISDLIAMTIIRNDGDIVSGITDAMTLMKFMTRNDINVAFDSLDKIHFSGSLDFLPIESNADFLASMFKDEFSLVAPVTELTKVHLDYPKYELSLPKESKVGFSLVAPVTEKSSVFTIGSFKDFHRENRDGGWYHGLSEMLMYCFFRPEMVNALISDYYEIPGSIQSWISSEKKANLITFLRDSESIERHGLVKTLSDFAILLHGDDLYKKIHSTGA